MNRRAQPAKKPAARPGKPAKKPDSRAKKSTPPRPVVNLANAPIVAIVGRPNVGKSTLFNVLSMGEKAIVHATSGTTRDARKVPAKLFDLYFNLLDTAGIDETITGAPSLARDLNQLALQAIRSADILLFVTDGRDGLTEADTHLAASIRKQNKPTLNLVNKGDTRLAEENLPEFEALGFSEPILISAAHSQGLEDLYHALRAHIEPTPDAEKDEGVETPEGEEPEVQTTQPQGPIKLAIVGRPNVGKSTLVNTLLKEDKMLAGPVAGLTREAIGHPFTFGKQEFVLVDTPGLRKKAKVTDDLEGLSVGQAITAIRKADVAILLIDASTYSIGDSKWKIFEQQDARIADVIVKDAKPLIVVLNKWDLVETPHECLLDVQEQLRRILHTIRAPKIVSTSALKGQGVGQIIRAAEELHLAMSTRTSTAKLNRILEQTLARRSPPLVDGKAVKLKYMTQVTTNPPTFAVWGNRISQLADSYKQFLRNNLVEVLGLEALPIRLVFRRSDNPFK